MTSQQHVDDQVGQLDEATIAGQSVYDWVLPLYDVAVHGINNRFFWRCRFETLLELYNENVGERHMDIGVGTGLLLDRCTFPTASPEISLVDLNPKTLRFVRRRLSRYENVRMYRRNILEPMAFDSTVQSIGLCYLLHCVPGRLEDKAEMAFRNLRPALAPGGRIFGATIVSDGAFSAPGRHVVARFQQRGIFHNQEDRVDGLKKALAKHFDRFDVWCEGAVALFRAVG
jgi:SAM-dependent methyltransferase